MSDEPSILSLGVISFVGLACAAVLVWNQRRVGVNMTQRVDVIFHTTGFAATAVGAWLLFEVPSSWASVWFLTAVVVWGIAEVAHSVFRWYQRKALNRERLAFGEPPHPAPLSFESAYVRAILYSFALAVVLVLVAMAVLLAVGPVALTTSGDETAVLLGVIALAAVGGTALAITQNVRRSAAIKQRAQLVDGIQSQLRAQYSAGYDRGYDDGAARRDRATN
jgi:hypothetical protein